MSVHRTSVSLSDSVLAEVDRHGDNRSATISQIVVRYVAIIEDAKATLRTRFSVDELNATISAAAGYPMPDPAHILLLPAHIGNLFRQYPPAGIQTGITLDKLQACSLPQLTALAHLITEGELLEDNVDQEPAM